MSASDLPKLPKSLTDPSRAAIPIAARLLKDPQFDEPLSKLMSFLTRSLDDRTNPEGLMELQADMASFLLWAQDSQKELKGDLGKSAAADVDHHDSPGTVIEICKRLQGIARQIADGIAWRALAYDRTVLRILAQKPHTGHIERNSTEAELFGAASHVVGTGELVVINDLTNFLRYGDFTSVGKRGVTIHEIKGGPGSAKSGRSSRQRQKVAEVIEFITRGFVETEEGRKKIVNLKTKPIAHFGELRNIISEAKKTGVGHARLSDSLFVAVFDTIDMSQKIANGMNVSELVRNPFEQSEHAHMFDSLGRLTRFSWNVAPYSIFPLMPEDRLAIMTGKLVVFSFFNIGNLYRCLRRRDLYVKPPTEEGYAKLDGLPPWEVAARELENPLVVSHGRPHAVLKIPMSDLARLFFELFDEESYADAVVEQLDLPEEDQPTFVYTGFQSEALLWD